MKVAVLMGGISKEREISLRSGRAVAEALQRKGHDVISVDVGGFEDVAGLKKISPEAAYIALHGNYGEDGTVQGILEWLKIPYTGPSVLSSSICFDKILSKKLVQQEGILTPAWVVYEKGMDWDGFLKNLPLKYPLIVKPNAEGSSIGLSKVDGSKNLKTAIDSALCLGRRILVEEFITGRELTVGVHQGVAYPVVEIVPKKGLYDYESKYTAGATSYKVPAPLAQKTTEKVLKLSEIIYRLFQCTSAVRVDYILGLNDQPYFLEVNTSPGMTETSLLPKAAAGCGISFDDLCDKILNSASLKKG